MIVVPEQRAPNSNVFSSVIEESPLRFDLAQVQVESASDKPVTNACYLTSDLRNIGPRCFEPWAIRQRK